MAPIGKFSGVTKTKFGRVDNILPANIAGIDNVNLSLDEFVAAHKQYDFSRERGWRSAWRPSNPIDFPLSLIALNISDVLGVFDFDDQVAWINGKPTHVDDGGDLIVLNNNYPTQWNGEALTDWYISYRNTNDGRITPNFQGATASSKTGPGAGVDPASSTGAQSTYTPTSQLGPNSLDLDPQTDLPRLQRFIYTEASSINDSAGSLDGTDRSYVTRLIFGNAAGDGGFMNDPTNQLQLDFYLHARGDDLGKFQVWGAVGTSFLTMINATDTTLSQSNEDTLLAPSVGGISACGKLFERDFTSTAVSLDEGEAGMNANYERIQVNLNILKEVERNTLNSNTPNDFGLMYCIYFVHIDAADWGADLAIDKVRIYETT